MSGETEKDISGWTVDTLRDSIQRQIASLRSLLDERHEAQKEAIRAALAGAEKAVSKSEAASEKRFEGVNEFRAQLSDQAATFMTRVEAEARFKAVEDKNEAAVKTSDARYQILREQLATIEAKFERISGKDEGVRLTFGMLVSVIGAAASAVIIVNIIILLVTK